ncbi:MAG TPA: hypothetical protein VHZ55_31145 [Bryobacteraceae bacterium]|jgi:hypothetical protein|nr:hypothetical protein [Bryobacteraceae bacterium]
MKRTSKRAVGGKLKGSGKSAQRPSKARSPSQKRFALEIRIRGQVGYVHRELCTGLEEAVRIGERRFLAFDARNPWFVQDSAPRRIVVLLDPETDSIRRQVQPGRLAESFS